MKTKNLTNPERINNFEHNDLIQYTYDSGAIEVKTYQIFTQTVEEKSIEEKHWRDNELQKTDYIVAVTDHPNYTEYITYRQELRDYPAQQDFPNSDRPVKP